MIPKNKVMARSSKDIETLWQIYSEEGVNKGFYQ